MLKNLDQSKNYMRTFAILTVMSLTFNEVFKHSPFAYFVSCSELSMLDNRKTIDFSYPVQRKMEKKKAKVTKF